MYVSIMKQQIKTSKYVDALIMEKDGDNPVYLRKNAK
jgi:hypothetical protein